MKNSKLPNPGSSEAIKKGCTCPVYDNNYGAGFVYPGAKEKVFIMSHDCPVHGETATGRFFSWEEKEPE